MRPRPHSEREVIDATTDDHLIQLHSRTKNPSPPQYIPPSYFQGVRESITTITAAQLFALRTTELVLVPAAGPDTILQYVSGATTIKLNNVAQSGIAGVEFAYEGDGAEDILDDNLFVGSADNAFQLFPRTAVYNQDPGSPSDFEDVVNLGFALQPNGSLNPYGGIAVSTIGAAGINYIANNVVTINDATITINTVDGGGGVLTYTVTTAGIDSNLATGVAAVGGSGTGFELDITEVDYSVNLMEVKIKVLYNVFDLS